MKRKNKEAAVSCIVFAVVCFAGCSACDKANKRIGEKLDNVSAGISVDVKDALEKQGCDIDEAAENNTNNKDKAKNNDSLLIGSWQSADGRSLFLDITENDIGIYTIKEERKELYNIIGYITKRNILTTDYKVSYEYSVHSSGTLTLNYIEGEVDENSAFGIGTYVFVNKE